MEPQWISGVLAVYLLNYSSGAPSFRAELRYKDTILGILPFARELLRRGTQIPEDARSNAWVSFDGKRRQQLSRGDSVRISMSQHPLPTVNKSDQTSDWFHSLIQCLNWNERLDQKAL
ncbi:unnamed protein product [Camellia sinensis]